MGLGAQRVDVDGEPSGDSVWRATYAPWSHRGPPRGHDDQDARAAVDELDERLQVRGRRAIDDRVTSDRRRIRLRRHGPSRRAGPLQEQAHEHGIRERPR